MVDEFASQSAITFKRVLLQKFILVEVFISEKLYRECDEPVRQEKTLLRVPVGLNNMKNLFYWLNILYFHQEKWLDIIFNIMISIIYRLI